MQKLQLLKRSRATICAERVKAQIQEAIAMAHTFNRTRPARFPARTAFSFGGIFTRLSDWNEARRTRNALSRLTTHELEDIGLVRGDIDRIADRRY